MILPARESGFRLAFFGGAFFGNRAGQFDRFRQIEAHLMLDDFSQGDVGQAHLTGFDKGTTKAATTGIQLAHAARDDIDQHVGVANDFQSFFG